MTGHERIQKYMHRHQLTVREMAAECGLSASTIAIIKNGGEISARSAKKFGSFFNVHPGKMLD